MKSTTLLLSLVAALALHSIASFGQTLRYTRITNALQHSVVPGADLRDAGESLACVQAYGNTNTPWRNVETLTTTNVPFDFQFQALSDVASTGSLTNLFVYVTNSIEDPNLMEQHFLIIRSQANYVTVYGDANWAGFTNTSLAPATLLLLTMKSLGPGDTNKLVTEQVLADNTFTPDPLFLPYSANAGVTNWNVNSLLTSLRSAGLVDPNGFCYPMLPGSNACIQNAFSSSYTITVHGAVYFTNGFKSDGSTGYGDTGLKQSTATGWLTATNLTLYTYAGTNGASSTGRIIGEADSTRICGLEFVPSANNWNEDGFNAFSGGNVAQTITTPDFAVWRTNAAVEYSGAAGGILSFVLNTNGIPAQNFYIGARNDGGTADQFFPASVKFALGLSYGLTNASQFTALTNAVYQYESALGRAGLIN